MIRNLRFLDVTSVDPVYNLSLESALFENLPEDTLVFMLWQNDRTVVIGRNQNIKAEVDLAECEKLNVKPVRRCSGGGAVYHDLGNLNFTFMTNSADYHQDLYARLIARSLKPFGIEVEISGRNDMTAEGRKFSGCAFHHGQDVSLMHGTLLVDTDLEVMNAVLHPDAAKLKARGVASVASRVINLKQLSSALTIQKLKNSLFETITLHFQLPPVILEMDDEIEKAVDFYCQKYGSLEWIYGEEIPYTHRWEKRYVWGNVVMEMYVKDNIITNIQIYSDSLKPELISELTLLLKHCPFNRYELIKRLQVLRIPEAEDLIQLINEQEI